MNSFDVLGKYGDKVIVCHLTTITEIDDMANKILAEVNSRAIHAEFVQCDIKLRQTVWGGVTLLGLSYEALVIDEDPGMSFLLEVYLFVANQIVDYAIQQFEVAEPLSEIPCDRVECLLKHQRIKVCVLDDLKFDYGTVEYTFEISESIIRDVYIPDRKHELSDVLKSMRPGLLGGYNVHWKLSESTYRQLMGKHLAPWQYGDFVADVFSIKAYDTSDENGCPKVVLYGRFMPIKATEAPFFGDDY